MTRYIAATAILASLAIPANAQERSITGQWKLQIDVAGNSAEFSCNITQYAATLKGVCAEIGELQGSVKDGVYTWGTTGGQSPLTFTGKLDADSKLAGKVVVVSYGIDGDFTASPVK
ncbi:hypothetical protein [Terriglobus roseus]|uniref:Protease inhibitor Inh n=1 Tax=Terriglobus roseus TaxID=392734 RepID=A0A1H4Q608_9BACT|nr:hypothetical protein [Terriglobus roseus]SEC15043.1 hypothetical protein SAMN05443244_2776 [Terriglobus roseus]